MAKKKVTRKQLLKEPDEFLTTTAKLIAWGKENTKALVIGTTLFLVVFIAVSIYAFVNGRRSAAANMLFGQALEKYQTVAGEKGGLAALSAVSGDFDTLIDSYGSQPAGKLGRLFYGNMEAMAEDNDKAIVYYQKALKEFGDDPALRNIIHNGLGTAYQQKGDYPKAIMQFQKIADGPDSVLKDAALFNLGKLLGQLGKTEESREANQRLINDFPNSFYANMAREKL
jgi:tetratricopeptide (TPR) repeat protein